MRFIRISGGRKIKNFRMQSGSCNTSLRENAKVVLKRFLKIASFMYSSVASVRLRRLVTISFDGIHWRHSWHA